MSLVLLGPAAVIPTPEPPPPTPTAAPPESFRIGSFRIILVIEGGR